MVMYFISEYCLLAQQAASPEKIPPTTRAIAYMALLGILLLGLFLIVIVLLGGHWVRRWGSYHRGPAVPADFMTGAEGTRKTEVKQGRPSQDDLSCTDTISPDDTIVS